MNGRLCASQVKSSLPNACLSSQETCMPYCYVGNVDPDRPKNDKATILTDTIQMLKDLTADVGKLKAECAALTDESREVR